MNALTNVVTAGAKAVNPKFETTKENSKGSIGNRMEYGMKQSGNLLKTYAKDRFVSVAGGVATAGAAVAVAKSSTAQNAIANVGKKILNNQAVKETLSEIGSCIKPYATKALAFVKSNPKAAAAIAVVTTAGAIITDLASKKVRAKGIYEAGKIDQEYTDKAKAQKLLA